MRYEILKIDGLTADEIEDKAQTYRLEEMNDDDLEKAIFKPLREAMIKSKIDSGTWQEIVDSIYMEQGLRLARAKQKKAEVQQPAEARRLAKG